MNTVRTRTVLFSIAYLLTYFSAAAITFVDEQREYYTLHTSYIFNFTKYVEWPMTARTIKIGVVGSTSAEAHLSTMATAKSSGGVEISVINTKNEANLGSCQIILIPSNNTALASMLIESFRAQPILIVTEEADFIHQGAAVSFKEVSGKWRFQINEGAIKSKGLKVSGALTAWAEK